MKQEEFDYIYNLVYEDNISEVYHIGLSIMRQEDDLRSVMDFLTLTFIIKDKLDCYNEMLEYGKLKAREQGLKSDQIKLLFRGL